MFGQLKELTEALQASPDLSPRDRFISSECQMFEKFILEVSDNFEEGSGEDLYAVLTSMISMFNIYSLDKTEKVYLLALCNICLSSIGRFDYFHIEV